MTEPAWPDEPERLDEDDLAEFVRLYAAGRIFAHTDLEGFWQLDPRNGPRDQRAVEAYADEFRRTWPLWCIYLDAHGPPPESYTEKIGLFWDRRDLFVREGFADVPRVMHVDDWKRVLATMETK